MQLKNMEWMRLGSEGDVETAARLFCEHEGTKQ